MSLKRTIHDVGEINLIKRFSRGIKHSSDVIVGIGDDTAVLRYTKSEHLLFASDMLVEDVHFKRRLPARWIGWKALACNVSDIAAMGGTPRWAVVSVGLPRTTPVSFTDALSRGLRNCARQFNVALVGGDTVRSEAITIDVAIIGTVKHELLTLRSHAKVGDHIFVTGALGASSIKDRHARFIPRVKEAQKLLKHVRIHAMIDVSDGLSLDAWQIARASGVRLDLEAKRIPLRAGAKRLENALRDGEDYELLFTVPRADARRVPSRIGSCAVSFIGTVSGKGARVRLVDQSGRISNVAASGFSHF